MTDKEILDKYIDLDNSCLTELEKTQVRDMIYEYTEAFSLRDEIGTCPNIEIDIDVTDRTPFSIRPYHVKEEDKRILDKEMRRLCYLGIMKVLYNILLPINHYISCIPINVIVKILTSCGYFIRSLSHCISP